MDTPENVMSVAGQHALQDMVELQMYLVAQAQGAPWPIERRGLKTLDTAREPYSNVVESSAANELIRQGFIEATSSRTFVVSKCGLEFYEREMKPNLSEAPFTQEAAKLP
jgi:hypothetical protein